MATMTTRTPPRPPVFTAQERHVMGQLNSLVRALDYNRQRCAALERALVGCPDGFKRARLIRALFAARQAEEAATLDLRDGVAYLAGLVLPITARVAS